ncbi:MAG TPA: T9SS type A sorting domain-containing protein [Flavobacteriales bacterium]|nr:T9SS type A sorting domain-containing protein [Flavobacteriales bacterium]HPH83194.1 T9SS type A sorting domain-containing protein [Flavobacteriales bacterium]
MKNLVPIQNKILFTLVKPLLTLALFILSGNVSNLFAQNWDEVVKAVATDRAAADLFGYSVAISGDYAIVGANQEDHNATGGQFLDNAGAAYILRNNSGTWTVVQKIVAADRDADDEFGTSVAIWGDYAIVGAPRKTATVGFELNSAAGAAYIFKNTAGTWSQLQKIVASDRETGDEFGYSVAISENYVIIGAPYEDEYLNGLSPASNKGSAYIYTKGETVWMDGQKIVGNSVGNGDNFGWSVGISDDYAVIGTPRESQIASGGGGILTDAGSAYIFRKFSSGTWTQMQSINASDKGAGDEFGTSVAISGDYVIVGAMFEDHNATGGANLSDAGSAYIFEINGGTWTQMDKIVASDREASDNFGASVSISGEYAKVGSYNEDHDQDGGNYIFNPGSAYIFKNTSGNWAQANKIVASERDYEDLFGHSVAISGDYAIVGAFNEDENQAGGNTLGNAGASYVFKNCLARRTDVQTSCGSFNWIDGNTYTANNNTATYNFAGGAASGCDSLVTLNLTINNPAAGVDTRTACNSFTWINGSTYTASNNTATYNIIGGAANGCDSLVTLNLTINSVANLSTTTSGVTITANNTSATYRWLDCNNNYAVIAGQTGASYTPTVNGNYAVQLTQNGCVDTSACVAILTMGIIENSFGDNLVVFPNPTNGYFTIDLGNVFVKSEIQIRDILGNLIETTSVNLSQKLDLFIKEPAGIYIVTVDADNKKAVIRIVKN